MTTAEQSYRAGSRVKLIKEQDGIPAGRLGTVMESGSAVPWVKFDPPFSASTITHNMYGENCIPCIPGKDIEVFARFAPGDRVVITKSENSWWFNVGDTGTIKSNTNNGLIYGPYIVDMDQGGQAFVGDDRLEAETEPDPIPEDDDYDYDIGIWDDPCPEDDDVALPKPQVSFVHLADADPILELVSGYLSEHFGIEQHVISINRTSYGMTIGLHVDEDGGEDA